MSAQLRLVLSLALLSWAVATPAAGGNWTYTYQDDFSKQKAKKDSYDHSVFWPELAFPPPEPYLVYTQQLQPPGGLAFFDYYGAPAHLAYCFPLEPGGPKYIYGLAELDVYALFGTLRLSYRVSPDGHTWTLPIPLQVGHQQFPLASDRGTCFMALSGYHAVIDNLEISLISTFKYGDLNCDGAVDFDDIDPFVLALGGPAGYYARYPRCDWLLADCNADGTVDFEDIDPFVALLGA